MQIIDAMVHVIEPDGPGRSDMASVRVTGDQMIGEMDTVGVDRALLVSSYSAYRFDPRYALEVAEQHPGRFRVIAPVDPYRPDVEDFVGQWTTVPSAAGLRILIVSEKHRADLESGSYAGLFRAAQDYDVPMCFMSWGSLKLIAGVASAFPNLRIVIDHLGIPQPFSFPPAPDAFADLPLLLHLAQFPNVSVKLTGAPTLSHERFPFRDIWPYLHEVFDRFGLDRTMWGTDWTRSTEILSYEEGVRCFTESGQLSQSDLEQLMGRTLSEIFKWAPSDDVEEEQ